MTVKQYLDFDADYAIGNFPHQRWGQAFCNFFDITLAPSIFYEENAEVARSLAWGLVEYQNF